MADRETLTLPLGDGWLLKVAGIRRARKGDGPIHGDGILIRELPGEPTQIVYNEPVKLNSSEGRQSWADAATEESRPSASQLNDALLRILHDALALLQNQPKESQADGLVRAVMSLVDTDLADDAMQQLELWHDQDGNPWASIAIDDHIENWQLHSKRFRRWIARLYHEKHEKSPGTQALTDALNTLGGKACFDGPQHHVHTRLAEHAGRIYIDLADDRWGVIEVDSSGWRIVDKSPVRFRRASGMLPLPEPTGDGSIHTLWEYLNVLEQDRPLVAAWLVAALRAHGPFPLLSFTGEQGGGKSTIAQRLRSLIDPNTAPLRSESRDVRDLMIAAKNGWIVALDNLSRIPAWYSDALCRLSTGGGFSTRELYSDSDEIIFDAQRPVILTAIEDVINRGDLLDRAILLSPPMISESERRPERTFWVAFEQDRPAILGALLTAVSDGLKLEPAVQLDNLPRMADFALWGVATEPAFGWEPGTFLRAYEANRENANVTALDASPLWPVITELLDLKSGKWSGTATDLLDDLGNVGDDEQRRRRQQSKVWPKSARALSGMIRRLAPNMREHGIEVTFDHDGRGKSKRRVITIERMSNEPSPSSPHRDKVPVDGESTRDANGHEDAPTVPMNTDRPRNSRDSDGQTNGGDSGDAKIHPHSNGHNDNPADTVRALFYAGYFEDMEPIEIDGAMVIPHQYAKRACDDARQSGAVGRAGKTRCQKLLNAIEPMIGTTR